MLHLNRMLFVCFVALTIVSVTAAQEGTNLTVQRSSATITATAIGDRVRMTAPASVVEMRVAVYAASGEKVFDQEIRGGNVFDWRLQDGQAQRLAPGTYVCVVTAKSVSGKLTQKIGTVSVDEKSASVQPTESPQLSAAQAQIIGAVEENSSWTISEQDAPQTPTVIAHDGTDGQMIRGRGALTFRIGNFFSGIDMEQMRLTEDGKLGIGTGEPKAKLDVAGTIRAERFLMARPKLAGGDKSATGTMGTDAVDSVQPLVAGTGTQNRIAIWTDNAGTLGDSGITEVGGNVGIGTTTPASKLVVSANSAPLPAASGIARFGDADGVQTAVFADAFGTNPIFNVRRANGTAAAPSGVQANQLLGVIGASGFGTSLYSGTRARVAFAASENWTNTANGSFITFNTTANGANTSGGTERLRIDNAGNVGIGSTAPEAKLDLRHQGGASLMITEAGSSPQIITRSSNGTLAAPTATSNGSILLSLNSRGHTGTLFSGDRARIDVLATENWTNSANGTRMDFATTANGNTDAEVRITIAQDGKVGVGTTTPTVQLDVQKQNPSEDVALQVTSLLSDNVILGRAANFFQGAPTPPILGQSLMFLGGAGHNGSAFTTSKAAIDLAASQNWTAAGNGARIRFLTTNVGSTISSERMRIESDGKVGIGTTGPDSKLHVVVSSTGGTANPNSIATFEKAGDGYLQLLAPTTVESGLLFGSGNTLGGIVYNNPFNPLGLQFRTKDNSNRMIIDADGNVGIGTEAPDQRLSVSGNASKSGGGFTWANFSDERLKNIKGPFTPGLNALLKLQPIRYQYKPYNALGLPGSSDEVGFSAQAVEKVLPEAVSRSEQGYLQIHSDPILWTMLNAIKEQQAQIETQRQQIVGLKKLVCRSRARAAVCK